MKIIHYVCPRRCGKTTKAKDMQMEDPENILLFTENWTFGRNFRGKRFKKIIFDEFLGKDFIQTGKFQDWMCRHLLNTLTPEGEIILFSTPHKFYTKEQLMLVSLVEYPQYLKDYKIFDLEEINKTIQEINNNFLNPSKVNIIKTDFNTPYKFDKKHLSELKQGLGEITYKLQIEGEFIL